MNDAPGKRRMGACRKAVVTLLSAALCRPQADLKQHITKKERPVPLQGNEPLGKL